MREWLWSVIHNCIIHPMLPFSGHALDKVHDLTAEKAYPHNPHKGQVSKM